MNLRVIRALILKYAYICSRNTFRFMDVFFWPVMDLLVWGFLTVYMMKVNSAMPATVTFLIGAVILWNVLYRAQQVVSVSFLDDVWSRNLLNIFAAPIRTREYVGAAFVMGTVQGLIVATVLGLMAVYFYKFNLLALGFTFVLLFANLILMGWAMGLLTTGFILRWGPRAEALAWAVPFLVQPVSAVFYPISVLPVWLQKIAYVMPSAHVFEGMREILATGTMQQYHLWCAFGLNIFYLVLSGLAFDLFLRGARQRGFLAKYGT